MSEHKSDHLRRLLACDHVTASRYTGTRSVSGPGNHYETEPIADVSSVRYGDWDLRATWPDFATCADVSTWTLETLPDNAIAILEYCTYSDYSGSTVERANEKAIAEDNPDCEWLKTLYGGHGTSGLAIDIRAWLDSLDPEYGDSPLLETIEALENYPLANEETHSELEMELESEAIPDAVKDIARSIPWDRCARLHALLDDLPESVAFECYRAACDATNTYPVCESAVSCYIDVKRIRNAFICEAFAARHTPRPA